MSKRFDGYPEIPSRAACVQAGYRDNNKRVRFIELFVDRPYVTFLQQLASQVDARATCNDEDQGQGFRPIRFAFTSRLLAEQFVTNTTDLPAQIALAISSACDIGQPD
jgi:hypothetical protein